MAVLVPRLQVKDAGTSAKGFLDQPRRESCDAPQVVYLAAGRAKKCQGPLVLYSRPGYPQDLEYGPVD
jgi:hypothetical protein